MLLHWRKYIVGKPSLVCRWASQINFIPVKRAVVLPPFVYKILEMLHWLLILFYLTVQGQGPGQLLISLISHINPSIWIKNS